MRRPIQPLPISPTLLKHFAGVTVVLTLLIALFAGGESAQLADELAARERQNQLAQADAEVNGAKRLVDEPEQRAGGSWGSAGTDGAAYSGGSTEPDTVPVIQRTGRTGAPRGRPAFITPPPGPIAGGNRDRMRGIPPEGLAENQSGPAEPEPYRPTAEQSAKLLEASMARSGGSGDGD